MTKSSATKSAGHLSKTNRYIGRKTRSAMAETQELSEVRAEMRLDAQRGADRTAHDVNKAVRAAIDSGTVRCSQCGRKISIPDYCPQCGLEMGKASHLRHQKNVRGV